ncbi:hypothetical protein [Oceanobacillus sp. CAU 1775]
MLRKKRSLKDWIIYLVLVLLIIGASIYFMLFLPPRNSLELYQELTFANSFEDIQKLLLDGYEDSFAEKDFNYIQGNTAKKVGQFTLFDYGNKSYVIMTSPGTEILRILAVEELPEDIKRYFSELMK